MKELFMKGVGYKTFILNMDKAQRTKLMKYYIPTSIKPEYRGRIQKLGKKINIIGIVEKDCCDCHINLPILEKLISTSKDIDFRIVLGSSTKGGIKTPTFIFMDENFNVLGEFIEKPTLVKEADAESEYGKEIQASYSAGKLVDDTIEEFMKIIGA